MAKRIVVFEQPTPMTPSYSAPYCTAHGGSNSSLFHPEGYSLWKVTAELHAATELHWQTDHGDEALFVLTGELELDGKRCGPEGVVIVEAGAPATVRALDDAHLLHFGSIDVDPPSNGPLGPPASDGRSAFVIDSDEAVSRTAGATVFYADGSSRTSRIAVFIADGRHRHEPRTIVSHKHSEDEIIHMLDGEINVGRVNVSGGQAFAVPGDHRYGFRSHGPFRFINYRRDISTVVHGIDEEPELETIGRMRELMRTKDRVNGLKRTLD